MAFFAHPRRFRRIYFLNLTVNYRVLINLTVKAPDKNGGKGRQLSPIFRVCVFSGEGMFLGNPEDSVWED